MNTGDKIILPEKYYLDNFNYLLMFVLRKYKALLAHEELTFIDQFQHLSEDAKCLYVRISNRKGVFFNSLKLVYPEITNLQNAITELSSKQLLVQEPILDVDELFQLIRIYNKPEIIKKVKSNKLLVDVKSGKEEMILNLLESYDNEILTSLFYNREIIVQGKTEELNMIKLFFFGNNHGDMSDFVIRDIGHAKFMEIDESKLSTSFDSREEAEAIMHLSQLNKEFYLLEEISSPLNIFGWFQEIDIQYFLNLEKAKTGAEKLIHKVGYHLERNKLFSEALQLYTHSSASPMRERTIRIFNKEKRFEDALSMAEKIIQSPNDSKEYYIALDVINKLEKKIKSTTRRQKEGITITIDISYKHQVENGVLAHFKTEGYQGIHAENSIWRTLFGLFFWDEIFDPQFNSLHHPLQRSPSDLFGKDFYDKRKDIIQSKLSESKTKKQIENILERSIETYFGITNSLVNWDEEVLEAARVLISFLKPKQIKSFLSEMAIDPKTRSSGFPDLFLWKGNEYIFYEVKSPTDHLSETQLFWLTKFDQWKINAEIVLVEWS